VDDCSRDEVSLNQYYHTWKNIPCTILSVTSFTVNYNETDKSQLIYEIKYRLYKIAQENKKN